MKKILAILCLFLFAALIFDSKTLPAEFESNKTKPLSIVNPNQKVQSFLLLFSSPDVEERKKNFKANIEDMPEAEAEKEFILTLTSIMFQINIYK